MIYSKDDIITGYKIVKSKAIYYFNREDYVNSLLYFDYAADLAVSLNWIFKDDEIENYLKKISLKLFKDFRITNKKTFNNHIVFYDQICNKSVLALQYLKALSLLNYKILYIYDPYGYEDISIFDELKKINNIQFFKLPNSNNEKLNNIFEYVNLIDNFSANKVIFHAPGKGAFGVVIWNLFKNYTKYRITPGDHHFYLGVSVTDYTFEYRKFGIYTSIEKRGFKNHQILLQKFYPIIYDTDFLGLPEFNVNNPVIIYTGGALYKTQGYNNFFYEVIVLSLLNLNPNLVILFSSSEFNDYIREFIKKNNIEKRFINIGYRTDFIEVLRRSDIYLGTYPFIGGLMTQYAAYCKKPILQYSPDKFNMFDSEGIESFLLGDSRVSFPDLDKFLFYAKELIENKSFRLSEGDKLYEKIISENEFVKMLENNISKKNKDSKSNFEYNYPCEYFIEKENWYLELGNNNNFYRNFFHNIIGQKKPSIAKFYLWKTKRIIEILIDFFLK